MRLKTTVWLRATLVKNNNYFIPPRLKSVLCNTLSCTMGFTTEQMLKNRSAVLAESKWIGENPLAVDLDADPFLLSNGLANQTFDVDDFTRLPILTGKSLSIEDRHKNSEEWEQVDDFDSSGPLDKHYVILDKKNGVIKFGDGENGEIPPIGTKIKIKYKTGDLENNLLINEGKVLEIDSYSSSSLFSPEKSKSEIFGITLLPSTMGRLDEGLKEAVVRARQELLVPFKVVSKKDCEYIVMNTPGLRIGMVKVFTNEEITISPSFISVLEISKGKLDIITIDNPELLVNTIFVLAIPYSLSEKPMPNVPFLSSILKHIDKHRLVTTRVKMVIPEYLDVYITAEVKIQNQLIDKNRLKQEIYDALDHTFRPLPHAFEGKDFVGWEFGRSVYKSEIISIIENIEGVDMVSDINLDAAGSYGSFSKDNEGHIHTKNSSLAIVNDVDISFIQ
ncbi:MAG: hypothetical protein P0116_14410 [Candidatus Nitrosocosmicus sp.]|nr:hypothetical protein [Candidatus Nitrosocosmicus sp.]